MPVGTSITRWQRLSEQTRWFPTQLIESETLRKLILDIGGEGRHQGVWNLNPSRVKTLGSGRGRPIPLLIIGRSEAIPLLDDSVDLVIVERTPLRRLTLEEIRRVIGHLGTVILRHAVSPRIDPHRLASQILSGRMQQVTVQVGNQWVQETVFFFARCSCIGACYCAEQFRLDLRVRLVCTTAFPIFCSC